MTDTERFTALLAESRHIAFFGGAGVSTESGLKDYRSENGIYQTAKTYGKPPETILSHTCFMRDPALFYRFYRDYFLGSAQPNRAHYALAALEAGGRDVTVVTQNIDGLHQRAGSRRVLELHGTTSRCHCTVCNALYTMEDVKNAPDLIPRCNCGGILKPDVVLYEEMLDDTVVGKAVEAISAADLLIIGGTSLAVQPAASFVRYFGGDHIVIINKDATSYDGAAELLFREPIGEVLERAVGAL